ncbi:MAG: aldehyde dehydrogenase EutE [Thermoanaerobaculaceae bacterium]|nr:aldehyde dehydrogenase EutE [Thermoanaerobaculaceae bacterium]MDI9623077.1 aldehyde dehydrogenase EutE [Acidobacteriota bacterium]NLH11368.1 aldehyde dehydrogenase EutE [Holophagae bacterium]HPW55392.1 aldehyde dehydrogenase EutE [Thermoanaerobaculaceae bacterium]
MTTRLSDREIEAIARRIAGDLAVPEAGKPTGTVVQPGAVGLFPSVDEAVAAAHVAQPSFVALPLATRARIIAAIRVAMLAAAEELARTAHRETGLGRVSDKVVKNRLVTEKTPGLEDLEPVAVSGDHGLTLTEPAPFGVIGAITPCTNPTSTIICNTIGMIAAGNTVVFNVHPTARECSMHTVVLLNKAIVAAGGPPNVVTCVSASSIETASQLMQHRGIRLLVVTGGGGVVKAAMASGKRAICAGPGNPPAVVDETADLDKAARDVVAGASTDNNIICVDEKEVLVTAAAADTFLAALRRLEVVVLGPHQLPALEKVVFARQHGPRHEAEINRELIGRNANVILGKLGISAPDSLRLVVVEVDVDHPLLWTEQMMPVLPICRVPNADFAIDLAVQVEGGNRHTSVMHSRHLDRLSRMARLCDCSIFVKNGRSQAGLGLDGEGVCSFTIASPTGEGLTTPRSFSRQRRCVLVDHFRIT